MPRTRTVSLGLTSLLVATAIAADPPPERYVARRDPARVPRQPYARFVTRDRFDRDVTFYLGEAGGRTEPLPVVVYVQGSGCSSLFAKQGDVVVPSAGHITLQEVASGRARVLIVEKPGVTSLDQRPSCEEASEFNREHTLERWAEAVEAAIRAATSLPEVAKGSVLVVGHSEGGLVACRVAHDLPSVVTHVAVMAGGGPSQLYDLISLARKGLFFREVSDESGKRVKFVLDRWRAIEAHPDAADQFFSGFAYRRWSTFLASSPIEELSQTKARVFIAQGLDDAAVDPTSADTLYAQLVARGKTPTYDRVAGADHSFHLKGSDEDVWRKELARIVDWWRGSSGGSGGS